MTINCRCTRGEERRARLPFGVPLEDIFPLNDIHPYLKEIFTAAHQNILVSGYSIEDVVSRLQGSLSERLRVKEVVALCRPMCGVISPGALLWVIRQFIGLIPVPVLPGFTDGTSFNWIRLSHYCKMCFLRGTSVERNNRLLTQKIAEELLRLPAPNLLLFGVLLNFIRVLIINRRRTSKIDKVSAFCLVKYFSSSIFVRPFRPGYTSKEDRKYFPLLLYVIIKWLEIEKVLEDKFKTAKFHNHIYNKCPLNKFHYFDRHHSSKSHVLKPYNKIIDTHEQFRNASSQTHSFIDTSKFESPEAGDEVTFLRDVACQTDLVTPPCRYVERLRCCCHYGSNYETQFNKTDIDSENKYSQTEYFMLKCDEVASELNLSCHAVRSREVGTNTEIASHYGWIDPRIGREKQSLETFSPKTFITDSDYIYDEYLNSTLNLISDDDKSHRSVTKSRNAAGAKCDPNLMARISKMGWTYTPPKCVSTESSSVLTPRSTSKTALKEENYVLYYNDKEMLDHEEKEKSSMSVKSYGKADLLFEDHWSGSHVSTTKSRRSFTMGKIKSKLDFLNIFSNRKSELKNSTSADEVSNIKYKKMNCVKSTMF